MNPDDLLDYALGRLDGPRRARIERLIAHNPRLAERVARLIRNLNRLLDDGRGRQPAAGGPAPSPSASPTRPESVPPPRSEGPGDRPPSPSH